jgi:glycosyltransferase involved in cell wall biosynthesis
MTQKIKSLQISSYPPPRAGWGIRVEFLKHRLIADGHECVVLNIGSSRRIPSTEYETVLGSRDYLRKVWTYCRRGYVPHAHVNGATHKGLALTLIAQLASLAQGRRAFLTFHAGVDQQYFPVRKSWVLAPVFALVFALSRKIVCNSEAVKARICEYGVDPRKVVPIPAFSTQYLDFQPAPLGEPLEAFYGRFRYVLFCYTAYRPLFYPVEIVEAFASIAGERDDVGLAFCGGGGYTEGGLKEQVRERIAAHGLQPRVVMVDDLPHHVFLSALGRASLYVRSHVSDGVCSSVLEAMSLGVPVVASENGTRPAGVITYSAPDARNLAEVLRDVLGRYEAVRSQVVRPAVRDTLSEEVALLTSQPLLEVEGV